MAGCSNTSTANSVWLVKQKKQTHLPLKRGVQKPKKRKGHACILQEDAEHQDHPGSAGTVGSSLQGAGVLGSTQAPRELCCTCQVRAPFWGASARAQALCGVSQPAATPGHLSFGTTAPTGQAFNFYLFLSLILHSRN